MRRLLGISVILFSALILTCSASTVQAQTCSMCGYCGPENDAYYCIDSPGSCESYPTCLVTGARGGLCSDFAGDGCPTTEAGACNDGFDQEPDGLIDCDDPDCAQDLACVVPAPATGFGGLLAIFAVLTGVAAFRLRR